MAKPLTITFLELLDIAEERAHGESTAKRRASALSEERTTPPPDPTTRDENDNKVELPDASCLEAFCDVLRVA